MKRIAIRGGLIIGSFDLAFCHNGRDHLDCHNNNRCYHMFLIWSLVCTRNYDFRYKIFRGPPLLVSPTSQPLIYNIDPPDITQPTWPPTYHSLTYTNPIGLDIQTPFHFSHPPTSESSTGFPVFCCCSALLRSICPSSLSSHARCEGRR